MRARAPLKYKLNEYEFDLNSLDLRKGGTVSCHEIMREGGKCSNFSDPSSFLQCTMNRIGSKSGNFYIEISEYVQKW